MARAGPYPGRCMILLSLATLIAGTFFGACLYVTLVDHPSRVEIGTEAAIKEFRPSARRAAGVMGGLSTMGSLLGLAAAWRLHDWHVGVNTVLLAMPIPVTLILIVPINKRLLDPSLDVHGPEGPRLLQRWGRLHGVRTVLGGLAFALMMFRLLVHAGV